MTIDLKILTREIHPENTVLLFGAGSSIPSGTPSGRDLSALLAKQFNIEFDETLSLAEIATLVELSQPRRRLIEFVQTQFAKLQPTKGILNLPLFDWQGIFTTNYDTLVEQAYKKAGKDIRVYSSNFDFGDAAIRTSAELFKIHGTLGQDRSLGHQSSMVVTTEDYDLAQQFRELVFDRLLHETSLHNVVIIGQSLGDPDLNSTINEAIRRKRASGAPGKLYALIFNEDKNRASLFEQRGMSVCFGGLDDFMSTLGAQSAPVRLVHSDEGNGLDRAPQLRPVTIDVQHSLTHSKADPTRLFNGGIASYGDIRSEFTFARDLSQTIEAQLAASEKPVAYLLGPAGFGKSTACRQVLSTLSNRGFKCWEHELDASLDDQGWIAVADDAAEKKTDVVLFIDDAHIHLRQINKIIDHLTEKENYRFRILLASAQAHWNPRAKTPAIFKLGQGYEMRGLSANEINSLVNLFEQKREISSLVEPAFGGFSRPEKLRRLQERCRNDMFVCLKNIFGFEKLDDIILRDYGLIDEELQEIYKIVAAMEASNVRVHRQLVMRVLGIPANVIQGVLDRLNGIITEITIDVRQGIYAWRGRHKVISEIILKYKFHEQDQLFDLYKKIIDQVNPSYDIERLSVIELCDPRSGIGRINDRLRQNYLYRRLISIAPSQRVPRHRLVRNLIREREFEIAENEIRIFEQELKIDAPMHRYKAMILMGRARNTPGLMKEDRVAILRDAAALLDSAINRFQADKALYSTYGDVGLGIAELDNKWDIFDAAMERLVEAEKVYLDPEMGRMIARFKARAGGHGVA
jgi:hypothetical protein